MILLILFACSTLLRISQPNEYVSRRSKKVVDPLPSQFMMNLGNAVASASVQVRRSTIPLVAEGWNGDSYIGGKNKKFLPFSFDRCCG